MAFHLCRAKEGKLTDAQKWLETEGLKAGKGRDAARQGHVVQRETAGAAVLVAASADFAVASPPCPPPSEPPPTPY